MRRALSLAVPAVVVIASCSGSSNDVTFNQDAGGAPSDSGTADAGATATDSAAPHDGSTGTDSGSHDASAHDADLPDVGPGANAVVKVFNETLFAFNGAPGGARRQTAPASFPSSGTYSNITLHLALDCPTGGCDHWDRVGSLGIVTQPPEDGGVHGVVVEVARFVTPYCSSTAWDYDVTDLAPLLSGNTTVQGFIDTWSPQGNPSANGAGWSLSATFTFTGGVPAKQPIANLPLWTWGADNDPPSYQYGDPNDPIESHLTPETLALPSSASSYALRTIITGHGQGNSGNCAEFCQTTHTLTVGSTAFNDVPWQDCSTTPGGSSQCGTWQYDRAGWCPGGSVPPWTQDVTQAAGSTSSVQVAYGDDTYVNQCRPDLGNGVTCNTSQCALGTGCAYDGGNHTTPIFYVSSMLIAYR